MGKKNRRREKKPPKELKSQEERKVEMDTIKEKLTSLGLMEEMVGIDIFYARATEFIERGESWSGKIKVCGCKRLLDVIFTPYKHKDSLAALLYDKNI
jgi:hypothetical protein